MRSENFSINWQQNSEDEVPWFGLPRGSGVKRARVDASARRTNETYKLRDFNRTYTRRARERERAIHKNNNNKERERERESE